MSIQGKISMAMAAAFSLVAVSCKESPTDYTEYFTGYDDRISFIVEGYQMHWDNFSPEDLELSYIYRYESPYGGFAKTDIDGDGTEDLVLGDQFEMGDYQIYDIFTFDKTTGKIIHLFCGGERDWCTIDNSGIIIETGSNSAEDSFRQNYVLKNLKLKHAGKEQTADSTLLPLEFDKFVNYVQAEENLCGGYTTQRELSEEEISLFHKVMGEAFFTPHSVATQVVAGLNYRFWCRWDDGTENSPGHCYLTIYQPLQGEPVLSFAEDEKGGPEMKVIIDDEGNVGRYIEENETSYHGCIQDEYWVDKDKACIETIKAREGRGCLTLKEPGEHSVTCHPDAESQATGIMKYEDGYVPEVYSCRGYINGWFLAEVEGLTGFIKENLVNWDAIDTF